MTTIPKHKCLNLGGLSRVWLAPQAVGENNIVSADGENTEIILNRDGFTQIEFETGQLVENHTLEGAGNSYSYQINLSVRKHRAELLAFERRFFNRKLIAVCYDHNADWRIVRNLFLSRSSDSGTRPLSKNSVSYKLSGNGSENATFGLAQQAIFWLQTEFAPNTGDTFDPELAFSGTGKWRFANLVEVSGNGISVEGVAQGLDGNLQTVVFDSENSANGITELRARQDDISGDVRLDLLPNLITADLALNKIKSVQVGDWVKNNNLVIELRGNRMDSLSQEAFLQAIYNRLGDTSNMKIGLLNQHDGAGNIYLPSANAIALAKALYNDYGVKVYLMAYKSELVWQ